MIKIDLYKSLDAAFGRMDLEISCEIESKQLLTLYGKSGVGKTSILRMLAGLMSPDKGSIIVNDDYWFDYSKKINLRPQKREVGLVFQDYALFPNMTVRENLEFALGKNQLKESITELIELIELESLQNRKPTTLSGGQKQRVALARALVQRPKLLLLDEPLSALDIEMRTKLQQYILKVHQELNLTTILVSHDLPEILRMSDQVILIEDGKIVKQGSAMNVFDLREHEEELQFTGELISIEAGLDQYILRILVGKDLLRLPCAKEIGDNLKLGDKVQVSASLVEPIIKKIN